jgi:hypothetical protein
MTALAVGRSWEGCIWRCISAIEFAEPNDRFPPIPPD